MRTTKTNTERKQRVSEAIPEQIEELELVDFDYPSACPYAGTKFVLGEVMKLHCGHFLSTAAYKHLLKCKNSCPVCKTPIKATKLKIPEDFFTKDKISTNTKNIETVDIEDEPKNTKTTANSLPVEDIIEISDDSDQNEKKHTDNENTEPKQSKEKVLRKKITRSSNQVPLSPTDILKQYFANREDSEYLHRVVDKIRSRDERRRNPQQVRKVTKKQAMGPSSNSSATKSSQNPKKKRKTDEDKEYIPPHVSDSEEMEYGDETHSE